MTRQTKLVVQITDGPWQGRRVLVTNPVPDRLELPVRRRDGSVGKVEYRVEKGPHGLFATRQVAVDPSLPTLAWRSWNILPLEDEGHMQGLFLTSANGEVWKHREPLVAICGGSAALEAQDGVERHEAPAPNCGCGIYAARTLSWLRTHGYTLEVFGLVTLWGRSRLHEQGFRYERAYPLALIMNDDRIGGDAGGGGNIFGAELGEGAAADGMDPELIKALAQMALLREAYGVPVALGAPERGVQIIARMREKGLLPAWSLPVLPPDVPRERITAGG